MFLTAWISDWIRDIVISGVLHSPAIYVIFAVGLLLGFTVGIFVGKGYPLPPQK